MKSPDPPHICLITKGDLTTSNFEAEAQSLINLIRDAVANGVNMIQIREKNLPARLLGELVSAALSAISPSVARIVVNDRVDVALASGAGAVHLAGHSMSPAVVRETFGSGLLIGASTHSLAEAEAAVGASANYIVFGPVFETPGKGPALGVDALAAVCGTLGAFPVLALGGVDDTNIELVREAGAAGVAAIRSMYYPWSRRKICDFWNGSENPLG